MLKGASIDKYADAMMFWKFACIFLVVSVLFPIGISGGKEISRMDADNTITLSNRDDGKEIKVKCGDLIRIELREMGAAGYRWHFNNMDTQHLSLLSEETKIASDKIGAPAVRIWILKTVKKGSTEIVMDHYRIWEGKGKASEHFSIRLTIE